MSGGRGRGGAGLGMGACMVRSNASWVIVTLGDPHEQNDTLTRLKTLPSRNFIGGQLKPNSRLVNDGKECD